MTLTERLASWALRLRFEDIPDSARHAARRHLLDGLGNALAAVRLGEGAFALDVARSLGRGPVPVLTLEESLAPHAAAFAYGTAMHAHDFDDTHADALIHPTAVVGTTALVVGYDVGASGKDVLAALVAGHEVMLRIGAAAPHGFHARGFHATSVCGVFAAAIVAARLRGLDEPTTVHALGIAGSQASGSLEFLSSPAATKQLHPGWAAMAGILATDLARAGATGPATILEGPSGLYRAFADRAVDPELVVDGLSERWEVERITIKPYPACQLLHASLDALDRALQSAGTVPFAASEVARVEVDLPEDSMAIVGGPLAEKVRPRSAYEAKFSLPWCIAVRLLDGRVGLDTFLETSIRRAEVSDVAERVEVIPFAAEIAPAAAPGAVRVHLADGRILAGRVSSSRGTPAAPLDDVELRIKFMRNLGLSIGGLGENKGSAQADADRLALTIADLGVASGPKAVLDAARAVAQSFAHNHQSVPA